MLKYLLKKWFNLPGWKQIFLGLMAGVLTGLIFKEKAEVLQPIGTLFIHAIQMLVAPVVMVAIVCAVISVQDVRTMGKTIAKALGVYGCTMAIAAMVGLSIANVLHVGAGFSISPSSSLPHLGEHLSFKNILINFIPTSPVQAFATNNVMQILFFSFLFGLALRLVGEKGEIIRVFFVSLSEVVFKFSAIVIGLAPYGVFALIACVIGHYGMGALLPLLKLVFAVYLSCGIFVFLGFGLVLSFNRIQPIYFFKKISLPLITAFTTSSSAATLPITMRCAREQLQINRNISDFLLPLGTTLNLNGLAIYLSIATIFAANVSGMVLNMSHYFTLVMTIVLSAAGAAAIPGSGLVLMSAVMSSVGVPLAALPLIAGVDRFNDMAQTTTNVAGDLFATMLVAKSEQALTEGPIRPSETSSYLTSDIPNRQ